jgi:hypothetical protein
MADQPEERPEFTWICPSCGRRVPKSVLQCRCGHLAEANAATLPYAAAEVPLAAAPTLSHARQVTITQDDLEAALASAGLSSGDGERLWAALIDRTSARPRFDAAHVAYYFGALIVISAMGWFVTVAWESLGGVGLFLIALTYAACFWQAGETLWQRGLTTPGGLLFTMAVCMTPLGVYGLERASGLWLQGDPGRYRDYYEWVRGSWFWMELGTIAAGFIALRVRPFPFLTAPIAFALWFLSMDLTPLVFGSQDYSWHDREWVSVWFGLAMMLAAYLVDLRSRMRQDFAFWGYLFGLAAFWGGLSVMDSGSELSKFLYCLVNVGLVIASVLLRQRAFIVFGSLGVLGYLGHLSYRVFADSLLFPFALTLLGIAIIYAGVMYQRNSARLYAGAQEWVPDHIRELIPPRARG